MAAWPFSDFSLASRAVPWLGRLATLVALALLAWLGARVFWDLTTPIVPEPAIAVDTDPSRVSQAIAARHVFGEAPAAAKAAALIQAPANLKLHGVVMPTKRMQNAIAILSIDGKPAVTVRQGEEIMPGVTLERVLARSVEINQGGRIQLLALPERGKS